jgi:restriction system protein
MARRRRYRGGSDESVIDPLIDLIQRDPRVATVAAVVVAAVAAAATWLAPSALHGVPDFLSPFIWLLAAICAVFAVVGYIIQRIEGGRRNVRFNNTQTAENLMSLDWRQFEQLVADLFRRMGYRVQETGRTGDGGVDLVLEKDGLQHLVQCKQYRSWSVGEPVVRDFYGAMAARETRCEGFIVTCGSFTEPAKLFAQGKPIKLIDGGELLGMLARVNPIKPAVNPTPSPSATSQPTDAKPSCPLCGSPMVRRTAKRGSNSGNSFWGCTGIPNCRGTLPTN